MAFRIPRRAEDGLAEQRVDHLRLAHINAAQHDDSSAVQLPIAGGRSAIVYASQAMRKLLQLADRYARSAATILITGESGTGKEVLARYLHEASARQARPYLRINCSAFSESLVDSALFGHERGAFTGADAQRAGCFEAAEDGTLFLDEIGELPLPVQARLLRVLEEREFHRVGSFASLPMEARIIAATNRNLNDAVAQSQFREDLYYRLSVLVLHVPPLRERPEDIPVLARYFLDAFRQQDPAQTCRTFSAAAERQLRNYHWPGNIRQLRNVIQRACLHCDLATVDHIDPADPQPATAVAGTPTVPEAFDSLSLKEIERLVILSRLERRNHNNTQAAESLQISSRTLRNKLAQYEEAASAATVPYAA